MNKQDQDKLKDKLQVVEWRDISDEKGRQIIEQITSGALSTEEWDYLKAVAPKFMDVVSNGLVAIGSLGTAIASVQSEAIKVINEGVKAARNIAVSSDSPMVKMRAFYTIDKAMERAQKMNSKNNKGWKQYVGTIGVVIIAVAGSFAAGQRSS